MDLNFLSLGTLVIAAPCCVFYATMYWIYCRFDTDGIVFAIILIWCHKHRQIHIEHTGTNIFTQTYKYILTPPVMCAQQLPLLHWMNNFLIQNFILQRSTVSLLFKNYSLVEAIHLLIRFNKTKSFLWNIKTGDRNGINEQNTQTTHREKDNFRKWYPRPFL